MSFIDDNDDEYSDLNDDDLLVAATQAGAFNSTATASDLDSPRPTKRQRLSAGRLAQEENNASPSQIRNESDVESSSFIDHDLPSPPRRRSSEHYESDSPEEVKSKYKVFVPKNNNNRENTFVTQLTQPYSSPSKIRGPRWKKPAPDPPPETEDVVGDESRNGQNTDDDDLRAAIAASLESFRAESSNTGNVSFSSNAQRETQARQEPPDADSFDFDDIPEDAFDSSPSLSPRPGPPAHPVTTASQFTRPNPNLHRTNLRQSTLFGMVAPDTSSSLQPSTQALFPADKNEPPTHHKLNQSALETWVYPTNLGKIRDYQFNIAQKGLFYNLLVALPTGLGKTFIAATVMLNWFRWTKDAQIVFVAPTKPLVSQQVSACFGIAGIPRSQTTMLTGNAAPGIRAEEWQNKRVFFMTPQTLVNDLKTGIADPKRIVLLVVDEAHRATGGYAYVEVVKFLRRFNSSFRVLALTATPGSTVEAVQAVIDGLDIARVEIRTEQSLDIREYVHSRNVETEVFEYSEEMLFCMDLFSKALQPAVDQLRQLNAYWGRDPMMLTAYGLTKARQQWMASDAGRNASFGLKGKINAIFTVLASLAHGIDLLKYHGIVPFYRNLVNFQSGVDEKKGGKYQRQIVQDDNFKKLVRHLQLWTSNEEFIGHPKLEHLRQVVLNHFMDRGEGTGTDDDQPASKTRIMIFVHFRDSAEEVTRVLKRHEPLIRPHVFVGQASAKGSEGMDQKTQLNIVEKFKKGVYNTIVATSIGEEGLDIGEVDLIVCYDSSASPIRMLQRMGRTGRKRAGNIVLLLMKGKEEESYIKAKDNYEKMQQLIASGTRFTFHDDISPRILPRDAKPAVDKRQIDIPPENSQQDLPEPKKRARPPKRPPKKFHMPDDVETGFTKASSLNSNGARRESTGIKKWTRVVRTPTPEPVNVPSLDEVLLTPSEQRELELRYCNVGGTTPQFIQRPRNDAFPHLQREPRPTKSVQHGSMTRRMIGTFRKMGEVLMDCEDRYRKIIDLERKVASRHQLSRRSEDTPPENLHDESASTAMDTPIRLSDNGIRDLDFTGGHSPRSSPLMCSPFQPEDKASKPFYASQLSDMDDMEMNLELPDISTVVGKSTDARHPRKRARRIADDDSDE
ncbi:3'-5' DNA helicase [Paecilomyces lecythidis]|uniref:ATP-dependent DNA helicase n=1 Tax=Paecilomyces lecythidis TaxID=3004212 RepID=A0ABR3Y9S4_9EURO